MATRLLKFTKPKRFWFFFNPLSDRPPNPSIVMARLDRAMHASPAAK
jgi:hypothetical protein